MRVLPLFFLGALLLGGCQKPNPPLKAYFVGATRFTTANRSASAGDTLATRLYFDDSGSEPAGLANLRVTVDYQPLLRPFAYPNPLSGFLFSTVGNGVEQLVYLDTTYATPPTDLLYTTVFGVRTSTGNERWAFTMRDVAGNAVSRGFTIRQRRTDSLDVYNSYTLRVPASPTGSAARRFLDLLDGLALPAHAVGHLDRAPWQRRISAVVVGSGLASPDQLRLDSLRWLPTAQLPRSRFRLTARTPTTFAGVQDTATIYQDYKTATAAVTSSIAQLGTDQVYAFRTDYPDGSPTLFGLLRVASTTVGLQLELRTAKRPL